MGFQKLFLIFAFFSTFYSTAFAQEVGAVYEMKYKLSPETQKEYSKSLAMLDYINGKSVFRLLVDRSSDSLAEIGMPAMVTSGFENQFYVKKDLSRNKIEKVITNQQFNYLLNIAEDLKWKVSSEKKTLGDFLCQKASVEYGGRIWNAWFTLDIPIADGPYVFHGLPGLIVEIADNREEYLFTLTQIKNKGKFFFERRNAIPIDWKKFKQLAMVYYEKPNMELERRISGGAKVTMQDPNGNVLDFDINEMNKQQQEEIESNNNPIELNHKINYN